MEILKVKKIGELIITVNKGSSSVDGCYRKVVLTDLGDNEDYDIALTDGDALISLEVGQHVLTDLRWNSFKMNGEWMDEYYVMFIKPMNQNYKIEFVEDWTTRLV
jgi:hypothetical protein